MSKLHKLLPQKAAQFLKKNEENKELVRDSILAILVRGFAAIATTLMSMIITRNLGAKEAGYFFLSFTIVAIASTITRLGTDNVILKYVSIYSPKGDWSNTQGSFKIMMTWVFVLSAVVGVIISVFANFIAIYIFKKPGLTDSLFWMGFSVPFLAVSTSYAYALQGVKRVIASVSIQNIVLPFTAMIGIFVLLPKTSGLVGALYFIASFVTYAAGVVLWRKYSSGKAGPHDKKVLWTTTKPLWTQMNSRLCVLWGGQFIAGFYLAPDKLSQLAVAQRTSQLVSFILIAINLVSAPRFAYFYNQNMMDRLKNYAINTTRLMTIIATPFILIICVGSAQIMSLFGKGFQEGALVLIILSLGQFINAITGSVSYLLSMSGHEKDNRNIALINGILSIALCFILIPFYGALGAAVATSLGVASQNIMGVYLVRKRLGFTTLSINFNFLKKST